MLDEVIPLSPVDFFAFQIEAHYVSGKPCAPLSKKYLLPNFSECFPQEQFASIYFGWSEKGIYLTLNSNHPVREVLFPDFLSGDAFEVFIDTRDVKTTGWTTRFCHHFFFLPEPVEVNEDLIQAGEITRFRTEDIHELAPASSLQVVCEKGKKSYALHVFIPAESLHGYEPLQFERLGFSYRVSRARGDPAFFTTSAQDFPIEQQPSLWASLKLNR